MASSRRDHLVNTAQKMFYESGYHATGIDKVLAEAGCAKMTLYNHFKSKDALILATLTQRDQRYREALQATLAQPGASPRERLLAMFDALGDWLASGRFHGCMFAKAAAEYGQLDHPIHQAAADHKKKVYDMVRAVVTQAGAPRPGELAAQLLLLKEGAIATAQVNPQAPAARMAKKAAATLIDAALG